jgi:hypothetical protein
MEPSGWKPPVRLTKEEQGKPWMRGSSPRMTPSMERQRVSQRRHRPSGDAIFVKLHGRNAEDCRARRQLSANS